MEQKRRLRVLNPAKMQSLRGGEEFKCSGTGDTIACNGK